MRLNFLHGIIFATFVLTSGLELGKLNGGTVADLDTELANKSIETAAAVEVEVDKEESVHSTRSLKEEHQEPVVVESPATAELWILDQLETAIGAVQSTKCHAALNQTLHGVRMRKPWAIAMYDSSVKVPVGIEFGNVWQLGNFDECMSVTTDLQDDGVDIKPQYCLADIDVVGYVVQKMSTRQLKLNGRNSTTTIHSAICVPATCSSEDIIQFLSRASGYNDIRITPDKCHINEIDKFSSIDILYGCVIAAFVVMIVFSTVYHSFMSYRRERNNEKEYGNSFDLVMKSFSVTENLKKLVKVSADENGLAVVNGVKAFAMFFIIIGHGLVFLFSGPVQNTEFYAHAQKQVQYAFLLNSPLFVDTFLLLSGFLFARLLLLELDKRNGKVNFFLLYIFRYIRLTPAYLAVIGLYASWLVKLGDGPLWDHRMGLEQQRCQESWWKNLLYINNYYGTDNLCMFQSWYLATDTQLFILAPLVLYPLWRWKKTGAILLGYVAIFTAIVPFLVTYIQNLDPALLIYADETFDLSANEFFSSSYGKTHMRAMAYVFGIITGYLVHQMQRRNFRLPYKTVRFFWCLSTFIGVSSMFAVTVFYQDGYKYTSLKNALYASLHRLGWSLSNGWLVLACVMGYGGWLSRLLMSRALVPISRLTYCAYLTNGLVELYMFSTTRSGRYMSVIDLAEGAISHVVMTFIAALVLCLMFESPIHGLEKALLRRAMPPQRPKKNQIDNNNSSPSTSSDSVESS